MLAAAIAAGGVMSGMGNYSYLRTGIVSAEVSVPASRLFSRNPLISHGRPSAEPTAIMYIASPKAEAMFSLIPCL